MTTTELLTALNLPDDFTTDEFFSAVDKLKADLSPKLYLTKVMWDCLNEGKLSIADGTYANYKTLITQLEKYLAFKGSDLNIFEFDLNQRKPAQRSEINKRYREIFDGFRDFVDQTTSARTRTMNVKWSYMKKFSNYIDTELGVKLPSLRKVKEIAYTETMFMFPQGIVDQILNTSVSRHWFLPFAKIMLYSCWRVSDLMKLQVRDLERGTFGRQSCYYMSCVQKKGSKAIRTPVPMAIIDYIIKKHCLSYDDKLFRVPSVKRNYRDRISTYRAPFLASEISHSLRDLLGKMYPFERVKIIDAEGKESMILLHLHTRIVHAMRSAGVSRYARIGMSMEDIMRYFTGHKKDDVLRRHYLYNDPNIILQKGNNHLNIFAPTTSEEVDLEQLNFLIE